MACDEQVIDELLERGGEDATVEFKLDASSPEGIAKDAVAFSNSSGGHIIVGVDPKTNAVVGVDDPQGAQDACSQAIYDRTDPKLAPPIGVHTHDDGDVVVIDVPYFSGAEPVKLARKGKQVVVERVGGTSMTVTDEERLEQILRERRGNAGFDQLAARRATLDDLDDDGLREAFAAVGVEVGDGDLQTFGIVIEQNNSLVPTNAGIILFGKNPERIHPDARFRARRYDGLDRGSTVIDQIDLRDVPLIAALDQVTRFIALNTGTAQVQPAGARRHQDIPHYDPGIVREVLHNAVAHADFSQSGSTININIFSDRIEADSPGAWVSGMSERQLKEGVSRLRNRAIVRIMSELDMIEERGSIWAKARKAETERGYPVPSWSDPGPLVRVTIPIHPAATPSLPHSRSDGVDGVRERRPTARQEAKAARQERVLGLIREHGPIRVPALAEHLTGVSVPTIERDVADLRDAERIEFTGSPRYGGYIVRG